MNMTKIYWMNLQRITKKKKSAGLAQQHSEVLVVPLANMYPEASFQTALKT